MAVVVLVDNDSLDGASTKTQMVISHPDYTMTSAFFFVPLKVPSFRILNSIISSSDSWR